MRYYWFLLTELSKRLNIDKDTLHKAFKKGYGIDSLKEADEDYVKEMVAFVAQEFGIILPLPGEPDSETLEKMPFKEFINVCTRQKMQTGKKKLNKSARNKNGFDGKKG